MDLISALDLSQKRRIAGRKGAAARWGRRDADVAGRRGNRGNRGNRRDGNDGNPQAGWDWYQLTNQADDPTVAELYIYDEISWWGITAQDLVDELAELGDVQTINVHLNSPGGQIFDGVAIFNALASHSATVNVFVDALAASIASVIAMAGDTVTMGRYSQMMIHDGFGVAVGDAEDMRQMADLLDKASDNIASVYADRAGGETSEWRERMKAESWFSAQEAVKAGLADKVAELPGRAGTGGDGDEDDDGDEDEEDDNEPMEDRMAARHDLSVFRFAGRKAAPQPATTAVPPVRNGDNLASKLNKLIDEKADADDKTRSEVVAELADKAGVTTEAVNKVVRGDTDCPSLDRLAAYADVLDTDVGELRKAAELDGCNYSNADDKATGPKLDLAALRSGLQPTAAPHPPPINVANLKQALLQEA